MGTHSWTETCPVCKEDTMDVCQSTRPYVNTNTRCLNCGFTTWTKTGRSSLSEINGNLKEGGQKAMTKKHYDKFNGNPLFDDQP